MDKKLQNLWDLYESERRGEPRPESAFEDSPAAFEDSAAAFEDSPMREEHDSMREMKTLLDSRPRRKPSARVVEAVLNAAAEKPVGRRRDRAPIARRSGTYLRVGTVSAVVIVLLTVVSLLRIDLDDGTMPAAPDNEEIMTEQMLDDAAESETFKQPALAAAPEAGASARETRAVAQDHRESVSPQSAPPPAWSQIITPGQRLAVSGGVSEGRGARPALETMFNAQVAAHRTVYARSDETSGLDMLDWDPSDDMMQVYHHIEMIGGGVDRGWEPPSVPLEMLQDRGTPSSIQPAGQRQRP